HPRHPHSFPTRRSSDLVTAQAYPDRDSDDVLLNVAYAQPALATSAVLPDAASNEHWKLDCIVLDAGHGGRDGGATAHGVREKDRSEEHTSELQSRENLV